MLDSNIIIRFFDKGLHFLFLNYRGLAYIVSLRAEN